MRVRGVVLAAAVVAGLAVSGCSGGSVTRSAAGSPPSATAVEFHLQDGLLTTAKLPSGFRLLTGGSPSRATATPGARATGVPIASMPCHELKVSGVVTTHAPPLEHVSVGLQKPPADPDDINETSWFGEESLDRYEPGQAAEVMAAIRTETQRCPAFANPMDSTTTTQDTVSTTVANVPADDTLVLRISSSFPRDPDPFITERAFVREGDVILTVEKAVDQKPREGVEAVLPAAVAAYRTAAHLGTG